MTTKTATPERANVLRQLRSVAARIARRDAELSALRAERTELFLEGRTLDPPVAQSTMAEAARVSEPFVVRTVKTAQAAAAE